MVGGQLDATDVIPPDQLVGDLYKTDLPDQNLVREQGVIQAIGFSPVDDQLKNNGSAARDLDGASIGI